MIKISKKSDELGQVFIDSKEPKNVINQASDYFDNIEVKGLPVGDLLYEPHSCVIERKEIKDFISSVRGEKGQKGRLWFQLENMKNNYEHCFVIIVGKFREHSLDVRGFTKKQFLATCASIGARHDVHVYHMDTHEDYFMMSRFLMEKSDGKRKSLNAVKRLAVTDEDVIEAMISCVPLIGETYAPRVVEELNIKRAEDLCKVSLEDLMGIDGIGKKKAMNIKKWF